MARKPASVVLSSGSNVYFDGPTFVRETLSIVEALDRRLQSQNKILQSRDQAVRGNIPAVNNLQRTLSNVQNQFQSATNTNKQLRQSLDQSFQNREKLTIEAQRAEAQIGEYKKALPKFDQAITEAKSELGTLKDKSARASTELQQNIQETTKLQREIKAREEEIKKNKEKVKIQGKIDAAQRRRQKRGSAKVSSGARKSKILRGGGTGSGASRIGEQKAQTSNAVTLLG